VAVPVLTLSLLSAFPLLDLWNFDEILVRFQALRCTPAKTQHIDGFCFIWLPILKKNTVESTNACLFHQGLSHA
jgi:hypothetical protein